jgi:hypothetical protein
VDAQTVTGDGFHRAGTKWRMYPITLFQPRGIHPAKGRYAAAIQDDPIFEMALDDRTLRCGKLLSGFSSIAGAVLGLA